MSTYNLKDRYDNHYTLDAIQSNDYFDADIRWKHTLVGQIKWIIHPSNTLEIADLIIFDPPIVLHRRYLSVFPFRRSRKRFRQIGLGTAMLEFVINQAEELGMNSIYGEITRDDAAKTPYLIDWYQQHGFTIGDQPKRLPNAIATIYREIHL